MRNEQQHWRDFSTTIWQQQKKETRIYVARFIVICLWWQFSCQQLVLTACLQCLRLYFWFTLQVSLRPPILVTYLFFLQLTPPIPLHPIIHWAAATDEIVWFLNGKVIFYFNFTSTVWGKWEDEAILQRRSSKEGLLLYCWDCCCVDEEKQEHIYKSVTICLCAARIGSHPPLLLFFFSTFLYSKDDDGDDVLDSNEGVVKFESLFRLQTQHEIRTLEREEKTISTGPPNFIFTSR